MAELLQDPDGRWQVHGPIYGQSVIFVIEPTGGADASVAPEFSWRGLAQEPDFVAYDEEVYVDEDDNTVMTDVQWIPTSEDAHEATTLPAKTFVVEAGKGAPQCAYMLRLRGGTTRRCKNRTRQGDKC